MVEQVAATPKLSFYRTGAGAELDGMIAPVMRLYPLAEGVAEVPVNEVAALLVRLMAALCVSSPTDEVQYTGPWSPTVSGTISRSVTSRFSVIRYDGWIETEYASCVCSVP